MGSEPPAALQLAGRDHMYNIVLTRGTFIYCYHIVFMWRCARVTCTRNYDIVRERHSFIELIKKWLRLRCHHAAPLEKAVTGTIWFTNSRRVLFALAHHPLQLQALNTVTSEPPGALLSTFTLPAQPLNL